MKYTTLLLALIFSCSLFAQKSHLKPDERVNAMKATQNLESVQLLSPIELKPENTLPAGLTEYSILELDRSQIASLLSARSAGVTMQILSADETLNLELVSVDPFAPGFAITEMPSGKILTLTPEQKGLHYQGVVSGKKGSLVALSIFQDEISAVISWPGTHGNLVLGKMDNSEDHILYRDSQIASEFELVCSSDSDSDIIAHEENRDTTERMTERCSGIYFDVSNEIFSNKGGTTGASNYMTSLFNQVQILYTNDNIAIAMAGMTIWSSSEPFSGLSSYQSYRTSNTVVGDLNEYVNYSYSGGVAYLDGLCSNSRFSVSGIESSFSNVPTYSWSVMVVAHELGHNMGSSHTHACAWNGDGTAIDGCGPAAGYSEGCSGSIPSAGGTIMSYCHLNSVGINFSLGFGPQPAARIAAYVDASTCLANCGAEPTCDDGFQNGDETGVDCGGSCPNICPTCDDGILNGNETEVDCGGPECPSCPCLDEGLTLTIVLDDYPEETSWTIVDDNNITVGSGGTYGGQADGSTVVEDICVTDGCYTLNFFDTYGDGICCEFGNGSYSLEDSNGTVLASGGSFGASESVPFCVNAGTGCQEPSNLDVVELDFGSANARVNASWTNSEGTTDCEVRGGRISASSAGTANPEFTNVNNTQTITQTDGSTVLFNIALYNNPNIPFVIGSTYGFDVRCACADGSGYSDWATITPQSTFVVPSPPAGTQMGGLNKFLNAGIDAMEVYPNPTENLVNIKIDMYEAGSIEVSLLNAMGQLVIQERITGKSTNSVLDVRNLDAGVYMLNIRTSSGIITERLIVK